MRWMALFTIVPIGLLGNRKRGKKIVCVIIRHGDTGWRRRRDKSPALPERNLILILFDGESPAPIFHFPTVFHDGLRLLRCPQQAYNRPPERMQNSRSLLRIGP